MALMSCHNHSYGTQEEYHVSGTLLCGIHQEMSWQARPQIQIEFHETKPFFIHSTGLFLD